MNIRNRIVELRSVLASELKPNPKNWRTHPQRQQDALRGVLAEVGIADAVLARELPDGSLMLIDGHLRAETITGQEIPVLILDVTEEESEKILATLDPLSSMAESDAEKFNELLQSVSTKSEALQQMLEGMSNSAALYEDLSAEHGDKVEPPADFKEVDENIATESECPKCGYRWSGGSGVRE